MLVTKDWTTADQKFVDAVHRMEKRTSRVRAYVVLDPHNVSRNGRVTISYPADGAGRVNVVAWLPGCPDFGHETLRHASSAGGYGYDKGTAAMSGAQYWDMRNAETRTLADQGHDWKWQLEQAGYLVIHAC
jgi:hypothetical protein